MLYIVQRRAGLKGRTIFPSLEKWMSTQLQSSIIPKVHSPSTLTHLFNAPYGRCMPHVITRRPFHLNRNNNAEQQPIYTFGTKYTHLGQSYISVIALILRQHPYWMLQKKTTLFCILLLSRFRQYEDWYYNYVTRLQPYITEKL